MTNETLQLIDSDMEDGIELAANTPGCYLRTQGDCNFAARLGNRERLLAASLVENERLRKEVKHTLDEWRKGDVSRWWDRNPRPKNFSMDSYTLALEARVHWLECGLECHHLDKTALIARAEAAEAELAGGRQENEHLTNAAIEADYLRQNAEASEAKLLEACVKDQLYAVLISGDYTRTINGESMTGHRVALAGLYASEDEAKDSLNKLYTYGPGWGICFLSIDTARVGDPFFLE